MFRGEISESVILIIHRDDVIKKDAPQLKDIYRKVSGKIFGISMQQKIIFATPGKYKSAS